MPSPFPGMDPYLESPQYWRDVHARLILYTADALQPNLLPRYRARVEERIYLSSADKGYVPDILISTKLTDYRRSPMAPVLDITPDDPLVLTELFDAPPTRYLEIIDAQSGELVTVIEVISYSNKTGEGRKQYKQKTKEILSTETNLVEIDLLAFGRGTPIFPTDDLDKLASRYSVTVHRYTEWGRRELYLSALNTRLPRCSIPLLSEDPDVVLDLPAVFDKCYDNGGYGSLINYNALPDAVLDSAEKVYLDHLLRERKRRV